jgi:multidrug efflux pump subunit AcrB
MTTVTTFLGLLPLARHRQRTELMQPMAIISMAAIVLNAFDAAGHSLHYLISAGKK